MIYPIDFVRTRRRLEGAVVDNVGGNEAIARNRERVDARSRSGWMQLVAEREDFSVNTVEHSDGGLVLNRKKVREVLDRGLGEPEARRDEIGSLDAAQDDLSASALDPVSTERAPQQQLEAALTARALRDLRDSRDLRERHPHLDSLADEAAHDPDRLCFFLPWIERFLDIMEPQNRETQAAMVFELGCRSGKKPIWPREQVASHYGVTTAQIRYRQQHAKKLILQAPAA